MFAEKNKDRNTDSLTGKSFSGILWIFSGKVVFYAVQFGVLVIFARLLHPEDFGLVGAAMVVILFSQIFGQLGVGPALVQRSEIKNKHIETAYTFSLVAGIALTVAIYSLAPLTAEIFKMESLADIIRVLAFIFPLLGISGVSECLLQRKMQFKPIALIEVLSYGIGYGIIGVVAAMSGFGVWSLVYAQVGQSLLLTFGLLIAVRRLPRLTGDIKSLRELLYFGIGYSTARIGNYSANQGDYFVVGRWLGADALGIYNIAYRMIVLPANLFGMVIDKVVFPAMSGIKEEKERLSRVYSNSLGAIAMVTLPLSVLLIILAPELIDFFLGEKWSASVVPFQILTASLVFRTGYKISDTLTRALGAVYGQSWRHWVYATLVIIAALVGQKWGVAGVATGVAIAIAVHFILMLQLSLNLLDLRWRRVISLFLRHSAIALLVGIAATIIADVVRRAAVSELLLIIAATLGSVIVILLIVLFAGRVFGEEGRWVWSIVSNRFQGVQTRITET